MGEDSELIEIEHHKQHELCTTRPAYRQGRKLTAIKVYTINNESQHLFVYGVPSINLRSEVKALFEKYGKIIKVHVVPNIKTELFTECYHVQFERIQSARIAKRLNDNKNFYGGILHVCYAPEQETIVETREKLLQRTKDVLKRLSNAGPLNDYKKQRKIPDLDMTKLNRKRKYPAIEITEERLSKLDTNEIWKNIPKDLDPRLRSNSLGDSLPKKHYQMSIKSDFIGPLLNTSSSSQTSQSGGENIFTVPDYLSSYNQGEKNNSLEKLHSEEKNSLESKKRPNFIPRQININQKNIVLRKDSKRLV